MHDLNQARDGVTGHTCSTLNFWIRRWRLDLKNTEEHETSQIQLDDITTGPQIKNLQPQAKWPTMNLLQGLGRLLGTYTAN